MAFGMLSLKKSWGSTDQNFGMAIRQLAMMMAANVLPIDALDTIIKEAGAGDNKIKRVLTALKSDLLTVTKEKSDPVKYPQYYNQALLYALRLDGDNKNAAELLYSVADEFEKRAETKRKISGAFIYPAITSCTAIIILWVILVFVIPVFETMYLDFGKELPLPTRSVINLSALVRDNASLIITIFLLTALLVIKYKRLVYSLAAYLPVIGSVLKSISVLQFSRYLAVMLKFNISLSEAVIYSSMAVDNIFFSNKTKQMGEMISHTSQVKMIMEKTQLFPLPVLQAVAAGEKANALDTAFEQIARYYEKANDFSIAAIISAVDMLIIVFLGGTIGGMIVSMYLPVFRMAGAVSGG